jgi:hypothetical protein
VFGTLNHIDPCPFVVSKAGAYLSGAPYRHQFHQHVYEWLFCAKDKKAAYFLRMNFTVLFCTKIVLVVPFTSRT